MPDSDFELLGHDNPFGRYPGPVVPVGRIDGHLVVVFTGRDGPELVNVAPDAEYVSHDDRLASTLRYFDYRVNRLFALSEKDVTYYDVDSEAQYFSDLLADPDFSNTNPFLRFSLAKVISQPFVLIDELYNCVAAVRRTSAEEFVDSWYKQQREELLSSIDAKYHYLLPSTWKVLTRIQESKHPLVMRAGLSFIPSTSDSSGAGTGAAMATALVAVALFNRRSSLESAYQLLKKKNYSYRDVGILLARPTFVSMFPELQPESSGTYYQPDEDSVAWVLEDYESAKLGNLEIVCAGPYAKNFGGMNTNMMVDPVAGLKAAGFNEDQAQIYVEGIKHGRVLMGIASVSEGDAAFFLNDWV